MFQISLMNIHLRIRFQQSRNLFETPYLIYQTAIYCFFSGSQKAENRPFLRYLKTQKSWRKTVSVTDLSDLRLHGSDRWDFGLWLRIAECVCIVFVSCPYTFLLVSTVRSLSVRDEILQDHFPLGGVTTTTKI